MKDNSIDSNLMSIFNSIAQNFYQDLIHPPAEQLGIALGQMASAVRITTLPFAIAGYTADSLLNKYTWKNNSKRRFIHAHYFWP